VHRKDVYIYIYIGREPSDGKRPCAHFALGDLDLSQNWFVVLFHLICRLKTTWCVVLAPLDLLPSFVMCRLNLICRLRTWCVVLHVVPLDLSPKNNLMCRLSSTWFVALLCNVSTYLICRLRTWFVVLVPLDLSPEHNLICRLTPSTNEFDPPKFCSQTFKFSMIFYSTVQISGGGPFRKACRLPKKRIETVGNQVQTVGTC